MSGRYRAISWVGLAGLASLVLLGGTPGVASSGPTTRSSGRAAVRTLTPTVVVPALLRTPRGVAIGPDGSTWATEPTAGRIAVHPPTGAVRFTVLPTVPQPDGIAIAPDGTLFVGGGADLVRVNPDGTQKVLTVPGLRSASYLDLDGAGNLYVSDPLTNLVHKVAPDGTVSPVAFAGVSRIRGLDVTTDGIVSVIALTAGDIVRRATDGTLTTVAFPGLTYADDLDIEGDQIAVSEVPVVRVRDAGGTVTDTKIPLVSPGSVVLAADGTITVADGPDTQCRCDAGPGGVYRAAAGGTPQRVSFGDVSAFGGLATSGSGTVLFTSWSGYNGSVDYALRQITGSAAPNDVLTPGATGRQLAVAPDGTLYRGDDHQVTRVAPGGAVSAVPLPTQPGIDVVIGLAVDGSGRLLVALGSGYGPGRYRIVEPLAAGGAKTWFDSGSSTELFTGLAGAGGHVVLLSTDQQTALGRLWDLSGTGGRKERSLPDVQNPAALAVDTTGVAYVSSSLTHGAGITLVSPGGQTSAFTYDGISSPLHLASDSNGTLYVADNTLGLLSFQPGAPPQSRPATPVSGNPSYTG